MKIVSVVGARPEFIQAAPVSRALRRRGHHEILVHTGQHYDYEMSAIFFGQLGLPEPDYNLEVGSGPHGWQTGEMLIYMERVLLSENPDWVIVRGDTNSTLAGALAATKLHIPVAHIEAGLRSFDTRMPEEINRIATDHVAQLLFCPTRAAMRNLEREGLSQRACLVGDVMYEAVLYNIENAERQSCILSTLGIQPKAYLLITIHRPDNTDIPENLRNIVAALNAIREPIIFPVHPRTQPYLVEYGCMLKSHVQITEPLNYFDMLVLEKNARLILTDSGGMQKEAYVLGTPCLTLRRETEWVETVEAGWNVLVGTDSEQIVAGVRDFCPTTERKSLYGGGNTSEKIVAALAQYRER